MTTEEHIARNTLFRQMMSVQHRDYAPMVDAFASALEQDPAFMSKALCYLVMGGSNIRDQVDAAIIALLQASPSYPEYREAGKCLLVGRDVYEIAPQDAKVPGLPPFRVFRADKFIRTSNKKTPRQMRGLMTDYVKMLETDPLRFDGVVLQNRKALKSVYESYHIPMSPRAKLIMFDDNPPADSRLAALKAIANEPDPRAQARMVIESRIPYRVAVSVLPKVTPAVGVALIEVMTPQEAINSRQWVEGSGLLNIPEVRDAYAAKVAKATASVATLEHRKSAEGTDETVQAAVEVAKERAAQKQQRISRATLVLLDKSSSMESAFPVAIEFGGRVAPLCDGPIMLVLFNDYAQVVSPPQNDYAGWQAALRGQRASGMTSADAGLQAALKMGFVPEQVVIITDGGINKGNYAVTLERYCNETGVFPHHTFIYVGDARLAFAQGLTSLVNVDEFRFTGDYYLFDQVAAILGGPSAGTLIERILSIELPRRV